MAFGKSLDGSTQTYARSSSDSLGIIGVVFHWVSWLAALVPECVIQDAFSLHSFFLILVWSSRSARLPWSRPAHKLISPRLLLRKPDHVRRLSCSGLNRNIHNSAWAASAAFTPRFLGQAEPSSDDCHSCIIPLSVAVFGITEKDQEAHRWSFTTWYQLVRWNSLCYDCGSVFYLSWYLIHLN